MAKHEAQSLVQRIATWVANGSSNVAIHAGHFMLLPWQHGCVPAIQEELTDVDESARGLVESLIARFPFNTWTLGVQLTAILRAALYDARLLTLVNDWYFLRGRALADAPQLRRRFYDQNRVLVPTYEHALLQAGLNSDVLMSLGPHPVWISEYWLRRRSERRLKRTKQAPRRRCVGCDNEPQRGLDAMARECRRLLCGGQADCAEEMMELLCLLHERHYTSIVNFVPRDCEIPVNKGCKLAFELFGITTIRILNVALPCRGVAVEDHRFLADSQVHSVFATPLPDGRIKASIDTADGEAWISQ